jgi:hypothetical protein
MTLVTSEVRTPAGGPHVGELRLRRFRIGELTGEAAEEVARHTAECGACRTKLEALADEQRAFENQLPFPRFAGGVERARRVPRARPRPVWTVAALTFAAAAGFVLVARLPGPTPVTTPAGHNVVKNADGVDVDVRIGAGDGRTRIAVAGGEERLAEGEGVRIGARSRQAGHLVALSIDDAGVATPLYPEAGESLAIAPGEGFTYLPESVFFTGHGRERLFVLTGARPFSVDAALATVGAAVARAGGSLDDLTSFTVDGVSLQSRSWSFIKP